jgi:hypothetical protein
MSQRVRVLIAIVILIALVGAVLGIEALRRLLSPAAPSGDVTLSPGDTPIYLDEQLVAGFGPVDLDQLETVSFVDDEKGKLQQGWLLCDVLLLHMEADVLIPDYSIVVSSSSEGTSAQLTWAEVNNEANMVMLSLTNRGTLKLVSLLEVLDTRDEWVVDADKIEIFSQ